jgi:hypothetical protein
MKTLTFASILLAAMAGFGLFNWIRNSNEGAERAVEAAPTAPIGVRQVAALELPASQVELAILQQLEALAARLETLSSSVDELERTNALREPPVTRVPVEARVIERTNGLSAYDLEQIAELVRRELYDEAWRARQEQYVSTGRWLVNEVPLRADSANELIEVICKFEKTLFALERRQADADHSAVSARNVADEQRRARVALHRDLKKLCAESDLATRMFLHIASHGELSSLVMSKEELSAYERFWLQ